jgi:NAD(P)H dehydrogenase (quinone)
MAKVAIVFFSGEGHTRKQAEAVADGVRKVEGAEVEVLAISQEGNLPYGAWGILESADAIIYGSPTYMGAPPWQFKKFADDSVAAWSSMAWKDQMAAGFTNSATVNGDKWSTIAYFWTLSQQHGQVWIGLGMHSKNRMRDGPDDINWTGGYAGAMAISPGDASPDEAPRKGDLDTASLLGRRVGEFTLGLNRRNAGQRIFVPNPDRQNVS